VDIYNKLKAKLLNYNNSNNLFLFTILVDISDNVFPSFINQKISYHLNIGMDIGPFLLQIKELLTMDTSQYEYIYKIHTKTNDEWRNQMLDTKINLNEKLICSAKWLKNIDNYNHKTILELCKRFNFLNIYYDVHYPFIYNIHDIDIDFYSSYYNIKLNPICTNEYNLQFILEHAVYNKYALNESQIKIKQKRNVKFVAGSIYLIDKQTLLSFISNVNIDELYSILEHGYSENKIPTYVHALERIMTGFIC